jgi:hypothetical protein
MPNIDVTWKELTAGVKLPTGASHTIRLKGTPIAIELTDESGNCVADAAYVITQTDAGLKIEGKLDVCGQAKVTVVPPGRCEIAFPDYDPTEWLPGAETQDVGQMHTVVDGEHVAGIAACYGYRTFASIWEHQQNATLRELRKNPHVLHPGDVLFVPNRSSQCAELTCGVVNRFVLKGKPLNLRLKLLSTGGQPLASGPCRLNVDGIEQDLQVDADGMLAVIAPSTVRDATLTIEGQQYQLLVGGLDPIDTPTGQQARLHNLGYYVEADQGHVDPEELRFAIELFQANNGLSISGEMDEPTKALLEQQFGC